MMAELPSARLPTGRRPACRASSGRITNRPPKPPPRVLPIEANRPNKTENEIAVGEHRRPDAKSRRRHKSLCGLQARLPAGHSMGRAA
jgi:hypothetical protein